MGCGGKCSGNTFTYPKTVYVEKQGTTTDDNGQLVPDDSNWSTEYSLRVRFATPNRNTFSTASGREVMVGNQIQSVAPTTMFTPFSSQSRIPLTTRRIRMGTGSTARYFNIIYAKRMNETGREVQIEAIERE